MSKTFFAFISLLPLLVIAENDWSTPCLNGWCSYDIPASESSMAATIQITGSSYAISDITSAAGWEILNCTADSDAQDIRLVCLGDEASCSHLSENGAEHTVVRLPPGCGSVPFAHVASYGDSEDQSFPDHVKSRIMRRDGTTPSVRSLSFNVNFDEVPSSQHGDVSMLVFGSTIPGFNGNATITAAGSRRRSRLANKRGLIDSLLGDFSKETSTDLPPINIDKSFNVFNTTLSCSANEQAKLSVDVNVKVNAVVTIGVVLAGSLIPLSIKEFSLFSDVSADLEGGLSVNANIAGEFDTGKVPIFSQGLPALSIPEIITLGPSFEIAAQALATVDLDVNMDVDLAYSFSNLQLFFPPSNDHPSGADVAPKDTPLKLSASPNVQSNATLEAHLIPTLKFGLSVLGSKADIFLDLDTFAALNLGLDAGATASVDTTGATDASAQVEGCVDLNGGVSVNAGADASLFGLFDAGTQVYLFSKNFDLFQKCFEKSTSEESSVTTLPISTISSLPAPEATESLNATTTESDRGLSQSASDTSTGSVVISSASFDPNTTSGTLIPSGSLYITSSGPAAPTASAISDSSSILNVLSTSTTLSGGTSITYAFSSDAITSTLSSVAGSGNVPTSHLAASTAPASTRTSSAPIAASSTGSSKSTNTGGRRTGPGRDRGRVQTQSSKMMKRDFQCLAPGVAAAASVVDKTLPSSSFSS